MMTFHQDKNVLVIATKQEVAKKLGHKSSCYALKSTELVKTEVC
jgi:hypothetical protein